MKDPLIDLQFRSRLLEPINTKTLERKDEARVRRAARRSELERKIKRWLGDALLGLLFLFVGGFLIQAESLTSSGRIAALSLWSLVAVNRLHRRLELELERSPDLHALSLWPFNSQLVARRQLQLGAGRWLIGPGFFTLLLGFTCAGLYWRPSLESVFLGVLAAFCTRSILELLALLALRWSIIAVTARFAATFAWVFFIVGRISWVESNVVAFLNSYGDAISFIVPMGWIYRSVFPIPITNESMHSSLAILAIFALWLPFATRWLRNRTLYHYSAWWQQVQLYPFPDLSENQESQSPETSHGQSQRLDSITSEPRPGDGSLSSLSQSSPDPRTVEIQQRLQKKLADEPQEVEQVLRPDRWLMRWLTPHEKAVWNLVSNSPPMLLPKFQKIILCLLGGWLILAIRAYWPVASVVAQIIPQSVAIILLVCWNVTHGFTHFGWNRSQFAPVSLLPVRWKEIHAIHFKFALLATLLSIPLFGIYQAGVALILKQSLTSSILMALKWAAMIIPLNGARALLLNGSLSFRSSNITLRNCVPLLTFCAVFVALIIVLAILMLFTWGSEDATGLAAAGGVMITVAILQLISRLYHDRRWYDLGKN